MLVAEREGGVEGSSSSSFLQQQQLMHLSQLQNMYRNVFGGFCAFEPLPVLELVPELDPVLELDVASSPELKPVPVLELELGLE